MGSGSTVKSCNKTWPSGDRVELEADRFIQTTEEVEKLEQKHNDHHALWMWITIFRHRESSLLLFEQKSPVA